MLSVEHCDEVVGEREGAALAVLGRSCLQSNFVTIENCGIIQQSRGPGPESGQFRGYRSQSSTTLI